MKNIENTVALITDIDRRKAIPIIRSLGRRGVRVFGLSYNSYAIGKTSKYCLKYFKCPNYIRNPSGFLECLKAVCKRIRPDVFYPIEDVVLSLCVQNPEYWEPYTNAVLPDAGTLNICYDKWETIKKAKKCGIITPVTYCPNDISDVENIASQWTGTAVIKPRKSSGSRGILYVGSPEKIVEAYKLVATQYHRPLIQEKLPETGKGLGVFVLLDKQSKTIAVFGHKRLREFPISGGPSTLRVSFRDDGLIEETIRFFKKIKFSGVAMAEYKIDERINKPVLMEINPRFWGSLQLSISAGVDFPVLYHQLSMGLDVERKIDFEDGILCRWLLPGDILHFILNPQRFKLEPSFFQFFGKNLHYDLLSIDDPLPILGITIESLRRLITKS